MDNKAYLEPLKFSMGDVHKQYYLYNWRCPEIASDKVIKQSVIVYFFLFIIIIEEK